MFRKFKKVAPKKVAPKKVIAWCLVAALTLTTMPGSVHAHWGRGGGGGGGWARGNWGGNWRNSGNRWGNWGRSSGSSSSSNFSNSNVTRPAAEPVRIAEPAPVQRHKDECPLNISWEVGQPEVASLTMVRQVSKELEERMTDEFEVLDLLLELAPYPTMKREQLRAELVAAGQTNQDVRQFDTAIDTLDVDGIRTLARKFRLNSPRQEAILMHAGVARLGQLVEQLAPAYSLKSVARRLESAIGESAILKPSASLLTSRLDAIVSAAEALEVLNSDVYLQAWPPAKSDARWPGGGRRNCLVIYCPQLEPGEVLLLPGEYLAASAGPHRGWIAPATPGEARLTLAPRIEEEFSRVAKAKSVVASGDIEIVNPADNRAAVQYEFEGTTCTLAPGSWNFHTRRGASTIRYPGDANAYALKPGQRYGFKLRDNGAWQLLDYTSKHRYRLVVDNSGNPLPFHFLLNGLKHTVAPDDTKAWTHKEPMEVEYHTGAGKDTAKTTQTEVGSYTLTEDHLENETVFRVAVTELGQWTLVDPQQSLKIKSVDSRINDVSVVVRQLDGVDPKSLFNGDAVSAATLPQTQPSTSNVATIPQIPQPTNVQSVASQPTVSQPVSQPASQPIVTSSNVSTSNTPASTRPSSSQVSITQPEFSRPVVEITPILGATQTRRPLPPRPNPDTLGNCYVLAVGISSYRNNAYNLEFADRDAEEFARIWQSQQLDAEGYGLYAKVESKVLTNEEATPYNIRVALNWLMQNVTARDTAVLMFSCHGQLDATNEFYIASHEMNTEQLFASCVSLNDVRSIVKKLASPVNLLFFDTCHSGQDFRGAKGRKGLAQFSLPEFFSVPAIMAKGINHNQRGTVVFTSSLGDEVSFEDPAWKHGAFTKALLDAVSDRDAKYYADGLLSINELEGAINAGVKKLTGGRQHPACDKPATISTDWPVFRIP